MTRCLRLVDYIYNTVPRSGRRHEGQGQQILTQPHMSDLMPRLCHALISLLMPVHVCSFDVTASALYLLAGLDLRQRSLEVTLR